jgi:lactoylglutathione lyase
MPGHIFLCSFHCPKAARASACSKPIPPPVPIQPGTDSPAFLHCDLAAVVRTCCGPVTDLGSLTKMRYLHSMIRVHDLDAAMNFFCDKLGLVETRRAEYPKGRFTLVYLAAQNDIASARSEGSPEVELTYNWDTRDYPGGSNFGHLAFEVDDIYQLCQQLVEGGITINRPPRDGRMAFVRSPDNISIELLQTGPALEIREPWASMKNTGEW